MPLTINLKPHERLIVNGVVIENSGPAAKILVHNNAALLREKDIVTEEQANTSARRIYFAIQCQYLFPAKGDVFLPIIEKFLAEFEEAAPSTAALIGEIRGLVRDGRSPHRRAPDVGWQPRGRVPRAGRGGPTDG